MLLILGVVVGLGIPTAAPRSNTPAPTTAPLR
jgi:hypothetical protein